MGKSLWDATKEVAATVLFGCMPPLLGTLIAWLSAKGSVHAFLKDFFSTSEPLLISAALVGPLIYVLFKKYGELPKNLSIQFPCGWLFVLLIVGVCVTSAAVYGYRSAIDKESMDAGHMTSLSLGISVLSLVTFFAISSIRNHMESGAAGIMSSDTASFLEQWSKK